MKLCKPNIKSKRKRVERAVNGSISIFLVIVLVPVISVAGLIVDASRYQLARSQVAAAADLTLNTALADYDTVLKDVYGLFAVSQSDENLQKNLKKYFTDMLIGQGVVEGEADLASNQLLQNVVDVSSGNASNLLALTLDEGDESFTAQGVKDSSLAEPDVLKNAIVEFNKYRGPMNAAFSILDGVSAFSKMSKQSKVTAKSAKVSEELGELNDACQKLYKEAKGYQSALTDVNATLASPDSVNGISYEQIIRQDVLPAAIEAGLVSDNVEVDLRQSNNDDAYPAGYHTFTIKVGGKTLTESALNESLSVTSGNAKRAKTDEEIKRDFGAALDAIRWSGRFDQDFNALGYQDKIEYLNDYREYLKQVHRAWYYAKAYQARLSVDPDQLKEFINSKDLSTFESKILVAQGLIKGDHSVDLSGADAALGSVKSDYAAKIAALNDLIKRLEECNKKAKRVADEVEAVDKANGEFRSAVNSYGTDDSFGAQMDAECSGYEQTINKDSFNEFKQALADLKSYFESYRSHLQGYRVCDQTIDSLGSAKDLSNRIASSGWLGSNPESQSIDAMVGSVCQHCTFPGGFSTRGNLTLEDLGFYRYLKAAFADGKDDAKDDESTRDELSKNAKTASDKAISTDGDAFKKTSASEKKGTSNLPSKQAADNAKEPVDTSGMDSEKGYSSMLENLSGITDQVTSGIGAALSASTDNLLVTDYAFSMFSWCTQKNELSKDGKTDDPETVTGIVINETNNQLYGSEIEYILYGKDSAESNVSTAKTQIFAVRFACNSLYALTDSTINMQTLSPALAIQAASGGVIPYQLPQIVMKLALAMAESGVDLYDLAKGESVPLFKDSSTWNLGVQGGIDRVKGIAADAAKGTVNSLSDKLKGHLNVLVDSAERSATTTVDDLMDEVRSASREQADKAVDGFFNAFTTSLEASLGSILSKVDYANDNVSSLAQEAVREAEKKAKDFINKQDSGAMKTALQAAYDSCLSPKINAFSTRIAEELQKAKASDAANAIISALQLEIKGSIEKLIKDAGNKVKMAVEKEIGSLVDSVRSQLGDKIDSAKSELNKKVADEINDWFDNTFSGYSASYASATTDKSSGYLSCLKFKYSDYLKVFLFIKLCANSNDQVLRMADLIQINLANGLVDPAAKNDGKHPKKKSFSMSEACTYYEIQASLGLKTMFLDLPMITEQMGADKVSAFKLSYRGAQGY